MLQHAFEDTQRIVCMASPRSLRHKHEGAWTEIGHIPQAPVHVLEAAINSSHGLQASAGAPGDAGAEFRNPKALTLPPKIETGIRCCAG